MTLNSYVFFSSTRTQKDLTQTLSAFSYLESSFLTVQAWRNERLSKDHSRTSSLRSLLRRLDETSDSRKIRLRSDSDWFFKNNTNGRK